MANPTPNPTPEKKPGFGRNLAGFTGQAAVALLGIGAVAPFRATEIVLTVAGQTVQMAGAVIYCTGLGVSWVGMQAGRPGDTAGDYAGHVYDKVRAWRTQTPVPLPHSREPVTAPLRAITIRGLDEIKAKTPFAQLCQPATDAGGASEAPAEA
jgi:hypothetical protein